MTVELARQVASRIGRLDGKVDLLYRDLRLVDRVLTDCAAGRTTCAYQPGHPHGFHSHIYAGEVHHNLAVHDPDGTLARLRARTAPYPPRLQRTIVRRYAWKAGFATATAAAAAGRGDLTYVSGCCGDLLDEERAAGGSPGG